MTWHCFTPGSQRRRLIPNLTLDTSSPVRKPVISPGVRWVDGPLRPTQRGLAEPFEIKVYEIDDVERLQRRRTIGNKVRLLYFYSSSFEHVIDWCLTNCCCAPRKWYTLVPNWRSWSIGNKESQRCGPSTIGWKKNWSKPNNIWCWSQRNGPLNVRDLHNLGCSQWYFLEQFLVQEMIVMYCTVWI